MILHKRVVSALFELYLFHHAQTDRRDLVAELPGEAALLEEFRAFERTAGTRATDEVACNDPEYNAYLDRYDELVNEVKSLLGENGRLLLEMERVKNAALSHEADGAYQRGLRDAVVI